MSSVFSSRNPAKRSQLAWNLISSTSTPQSIPTSSQPSRVVVYPDFPELYSPHPNSEYTLNPSLSFEERRTQQVSVSSNPVVYPLSDGVGYDIQSHVIYVRPCRRGSRPPPILTPHYPHVAMPPSAPRTSAFKQGLNKMVSYLKTNHV